MVDSRRRQPLEDFSRRLAAIEAMMTEVSRVEGTLDASGRRVGIVAARFNERIADRLLTGAIDCLVRHGASPEAIEVVRVPGAWEVPQALDLLAGSGAFDALIALGVVIRGGTPHFEYICAGCTQGVGRVAAEHHLPVAYGVLTCDTSEQAEERAGGKAGNKGWDAALAAIEMSSVYAQVRSGAQIRGDESARA